MNDFMLLSAASRFPIRRLDIGEFEEISGKGMRFHTRVYDADGAGRLCLMEMRAFFGLMKMESAVFSPVGLDGPLFSCDLVDAMGEDTLLLELYDTTISHPGMGALGEIMASYGTLPAHDPGVHGRVFLSSARLRGVRSRREAEAERRIRRRTVEKRRSGGRHLPEDPGGGKDGPVFEEIYVLL